MAMAKMARNPSLALLYCVWKSGPKAALCTGAAAMETTAEATETASAEASKKEKIAGERDSELYRRLSSLPVTGGSVGKVLNKWLREGKSVHKYQLVRFVRQFRRYNRYEDALKLHEWMDRRGMNMSFSDYAVQLDLVYKCKGIDAAETYFEKLPEPAKNRLTHGSLLNCFCMEKNLEKAMAIFDKMKDLNFFFTSLNYNNMMSLYMKLGQYEKVSPLFQVMKEQGIMPDTYSYNLLMNSHASLNDIDAVESLVHEVKSGSGAAYCDWTIYSNLAAIYVAAGLFDKAESALKELEEMGPFKDRMPCHFLITLYASCSNLAAVKRIWESLRSAFPQTNNSSFFVILQALARLDDFNGLTQCFAEWESCATRYDIRLANVMIDTYLRRGMISEGELIRETALKKLHKPSFKTLEIFMDFYLKNHQYDLALKEFETAVMMVKKNEWQPNRNKVTSLLKHFEEMKDVDGAEEFYRKLKKINCLCPDVYNSLLRTYIAAGKSEPGLHQRMKYDGIEVNSETEVLLDNLPGVD